MSIYNYIRNNRSIIIIAYTAKDFPIQFPSTQH